MTGKSLLCDLLKLTLGEYYDQLDISCLTQNELVLKNQDQIS